MRAPHNPLRRALRRVAAVRAAASPTKRPATSAARLDGRPWSGGTAVGLQWMRPAQAGASALGKAGAKVAGDDGRGADGYEVEADMSTSQEHGTANGYEVEVEA